MLPLFSTSLGISYNSHKYDFLAEELQKLFTLALCEKYKVLSPKKRTALEELSYKTEDMFFNDNGLNTVLMYHNYILSDIDKKHRICIRCTARVNLREGVLRCCR